MGSAVECTQSTWEIQILGMMELHGQGVGLEVGLAVTPLWQPKPHPVL